MDSTDNSAIMTIDLRRSRFRVHKSTLNKMGLPQYVQFLVNPEEMFIAILGSDRPLSGGTANNVQQFQLTKVGFMSVRQLSRIAKERGAGSLGYAEAMLVAYNRKCRYTLRMTKLHSGAITAEDDFIEENEDSLADAPVLEK